MFIRGFVYVSCVVLHASCLFIVCVWYVPRMCYVFLVCSRCVCVLICFLYVECMVHVYGVVRILFRVGVLHVSCMVLYGSCMFVYGYCMFIV